MNWDRIIESKIREAQAEGKFDNLRGKGQPLRLDDDPFEDPAWQMANDLLKQNDLRPDWLEQDIELRGQLTQARAALQRSDRWRKETLATLGERKDLEAQRKRDYVAQEWARAQERFRISLTEINQSIVTLNLKVPHTRLQRRKLVLDDELKRLLG